MVPAIVRNAARDQLESLPAIVGIRKVILNGLQPAQMTLATLMQPLPIGWREQRLIFACSTRCRRQTARQT
jgi:hypothetical protein